MLNSPLFIILNRKTRSKHLSSLSLCASGWRVRFGRNVRDLCQLSLSVHWRLTPRAEDWLSTGPRDSCWRLECYQLCLCCLARHTVGSVVGEVRWIYLLDSPLGSVCSDYIGYGRTCVSPVSTTYYSVGLLTGVFRRWKACACESFVSRFNLNLFSKVGSDKVFKSDEWS